LEKAHKQTESHLQEINKLKDEFVFVAAHELRAPITVLKAYVAEIVDDEKLIKKMEKSNPYFVEVIHSIDAAKDRLSNLLNDLLDVARMEAGKFKVNIQEVDFAEAVGPLIQNLAQLGKPRGITVALKLNSEIPRIKIDPDRVNEVLTNLVANAIKYNLDGGKVTVSASYADKKLSVEVADTGVGLSEEEKKHLFEKFWRSDDVRQIEGTGLGLFIVKHILDQLNGTISFDSKKGEGTVFKFSLPAF
jgi:two-component system, OmpR family, sensor histidine kinase ResE